MSENPPNTGLNRSLTAWITKNRRARHISHHNPLMIGNIIKRILMAGFLAEQWNDLP